MKNYKSIACIDFVNVNIALNSHAYEKTRVFTRVHKIVVFSVDF